MRESFFQENRENRIRERVVKRECNKVHQLVNYDLMLHRISGLNALASVDYKWWRKACKMNTKSEKGPE